MITDEELRALIERGEEPSQQTVEKQRFVSDLWCGVSFFSCTFKACKFNSVDLRESALMNCQFEDCEFTNCNLNNIRILKTSLKRCSFIGPRMSGVQCLKSEFFDCKIEGSRINGGQFMETDFQETRFSELEWERVTVMQGVIESSCFQNGAMKNSCFVDSEIKNTKFASIEFNEFMFKGGDFSGHDWSNMSLNKVQFYDVRSVGARFCNTKTWHMGIHESDFSGSDSRSVEGDFLRVYKSSITDAIFDGAILNNAQFTESTLLQSSFRGAKMGKAMIMDCDASRANFDSVDFRMGEMVKTIVYGSRLTQIDCRLSKFDELIEDDDTNWVGTLRTLARPQDSERKEKLGAV